MAEPPKSQIEGLIGEISIEAVRSWLKSKGLTHSAGSREALVQRVAKLIRKGRLSLEELREGAIRLQEASSKRVILFQLKPEDVVRLQNSRGLLRKGQQISRSCTDTPRLAPNKPASPTLVYLHKTDKQVRMKFAETQTRVEFNVINERMDRVQTTKIIVAVADFEAGIIQLRIDSPEDLHRHRDAKRRPKDALYVAFYLERVSGLLDCELEPIDLRPILRRLSEADPRIIEMAMGKVRTAANSKWRMSSPGDIRDDPDYKAAHGKGGKAWAHEAGGIKWKEEASGGKLTRSLFTYINASEGTLRFLADCHDAEIEYAVSRIREYQKKTPRS